MIGIGMTPAMVAAAAATPCGDGSMVTLLPVAASADDYDGDVNPVTHPTISAQFNNVAVVDWGAVAEITDATGTDTIIGLSFSYYHHAYTKSKLTTYHRIWRLNGVQVGASTLEPAEGWHTIDSAALLAAYNKNGLNVFTWVVNDPGSTYYRAWTIRSYDYDAHQFVPYFAVTHAPV